MWTRVYFNISTMFDLFTTTKRQDYIIKDKTETNQASILILWHPKCTKVKTRCQCVQAVYFAN